MKLKPFFIFTLVICLVSCNTSSTSEGSASSADVPSKHSEKSSEPQPDESQPELIKVTSSNFSDGDIIPAAFYYNDGFWCSGENRFPSLAWTNIPIGTKSFVIIMDDHTTDDPSSPPFVHLNLYNISADVKGFDELEPEGGVDTLEFSSGQLGTNFYSKLIWSGPCPPGPEVHEYVFTVYAMSVAELVEPLSETSSTEFQLDNSSIIISSGTLRGFAAKIPAVE